PRFHFFAGNTPASWHPDVCAYARVTYRDLWPGIDLNLATSRDGFEATLSAAPATIAPPGSGARFVLERGDGVAPREVGLSAALAEFPVCAASTPVGTLDDTSTLLWGTYLGGASSEYGRAVRLDSHGNP